MSGYLAERAWLPSGMAANVRIDIADGRITEVVADSVATDGTRRLAGLTLPGFANTHSHAFHRALRGRTHDGGGTFWSWRERMYRIAGQLDPDSYYALARATYAEMALAGVSAVGEFHYLHHDPTGRAYADPNAMGRALTAAAADAGLRITLLDTCYLSGGLGPSGPLPLAPEQRRFSDGTAAGWAARVASIGALPDHAQVGAAIHSVRAVPRDQLAPVVAAAAGRPLHVHLSEQPAENAQCQSAYGCTPTELLASAGAWGPTACAVHATHLAPADVAILGASRTSISMCPSTESDLADGIGPARELLAAGAPITLGSDQHAVIDLLTEAQLLEQHERLATGVRGRFTPAQLLTALTADGHRAIGWPDAGRIAVGQRADLVAVRADSPRTAGSDRRQLVLTASAADVDTVVIDGVEVVAGGRHRLGDVGRLLTEAIAPLWD